MPSQTINQFLAHKQFTDNAQMRSFVNVDASTKEKLKEMQLLDTAENTAAALKSFFC
jgi:hypothetical protein